ncbi:hypothetical protein ABGB19_22445 [Mycobacterium sp. B14F4]|uniref:hypothetical protein n=1 Tax=Mycobacterium sp. B14F4 TaxID=3153565 RepID=UPI00325D5CAB
MAHFSWMGGPHDCEQRFDDLQRLQVILPEPPTRYFCGNAYRSRLNQLIVIDDVELIHLERFFERVRDDDEAVALRVFVRAGTLQFFGTPGMFSAEVGYSEDD